MWSFSFIHIVWLAESANPVQMVIARNYFAAPVLAVLWWWRRPRIRGLSRTQWALIIGIALASGPIYHLPLHWGGSEGRAQASLIGLIIATIPIHVGWLAWITLGESLTWQRMVGLLLGLGGIFVVLGGTRGLDLLPAEVAGPIAVTVAAVIAAFAMVMTRGSRHVFNPLDLACVASTIGLLICVVATPFSSMESLAHMPLRGVWSAFYLGFFGIGLAYVCWFTALSGGLPAASVAMYLFVPCVLSAVWAWLWQDNQIGLPFFAGAAMVLVGLIIGGRSNRVKSTKPEPAAARALPVEDRV